jgi:hypothetical protein
VQSGQDCELELEERRERDTTGREGGREGGRVPSMGEDLCRIPKVELDDILGSANGFLAVVLTRCS